MRHLVRVQGGTDGNLLSDNAENPNKTDHTDTHCHPFTALDHVIGVRIPASQQTQQ
jgi:hypothetical protein